MQVQFNGRIPAFQAGRVGSIPITRSNICVCSSVGQSNCLLSNGPGVRIPPDTPISFWNSKRVQCAQITTAIIWWVQFSWLERQFVALNVVGSNPTTHPILILIYRDIAKSVRHQILILACVGSSPAIPARAISSVGRALDF